MHCRRWSFDLGTEFLSAATDGDDNSDESGNPCVSLIPMQHFESAERNQQRQYGDDDNSDRGAHGCTMSYCGEGHAADDGVNDAETG